MCTLPQPIARRGVALSPSCLDMEWSFLSKVRNTRLLMIHKYKVLSWQLLMTRYSHMICAAYTPHRGRGSISRTNGRRWWGGGISLQHPKVCSLWSDFLKIPNTQPHRFKYPNLKEKLDDFRSHLVQSAREMPELKVWQLQDLDFQAAQRIMSSVSELRLKVMKDIAQNLPMQAKWVIVFYIRRKQKKLWAPPNVQSLLSLGHCLEHKWAKTYIRKSQRIKRLEQGLWTLYQLVLSNVHNNIIPVDVAVNRGFPRWQHYAPQWHHP